MHSEKPRNIFLYILNRNIMIKPDLLNLGQIHYDIDFRLHKNVTRAEHRILKHQKRRHIFKVMKKYFSNGFYERISLEDFYSCTVRNQEIFFHTFEQKKYD